MAATPSGASAPPRAASAAVVLAIGGAALLAAIALFTLTQYASTRTALIAEGQSPASVDEALFVAYTTAVGGTLVVVAALVVFALILRRGRSWARPALVLTSIVSALTVVVLGGASIFGVLMPAVADVLAFQRPVSEWLLARRGPG